MAWHGPGRAVRQRQVEEWAGLAPDAAAAAVMVGRPDAAVELLEQGRSLLWTQALMLRSDLSRLAEIAPDLAERLDSIRVALASPVSEITPPVPVLRGAASLLHDVAIESPGFSRTGPGGWTRSPECDEKSGVNREAHAPFCGSPLLCDSPGHRPSVRSGGSARPLRLY